MGISAEYVTLLRVGIQTSPEWKEAWERINDYLDALKTPDSIDRELILLTSFENAIARKREEPFAPATELAFEETQKTLDSSLGHLIGKEVPDNLRSVEERVRLYLTENIDGSLLNQEDQISEEVLQALREVRLRPVPGLQIASVTSRPLDLSDFGKRIMRLAAKLSTAGANRLLMWSIVLLLFTLLIYSSF
ncbi:MAG: hypothetical protein JO076_03650 [Verrucomicrobia bacterium]|nr:hypothetical protein [Verrucomicrobiota bacterium]